MTFVFDYSYAHNNSCIVKISYVRPTSNLGSKTKIDLYDVLGVKRDDYQGNYSRNGHESSKSVAKSPKFRGTQGFNRQMMDESKSAQDLQNHLIESGFIKPDRKGVVIDTSNGGAVASSTFDEDVQVHAVMRSPISKSRTAPPPSQVQHVAGSTIPKSEQYRPVPSDILFVRTQGIEGGDYTINSVSRLWTMDADGCNYSC